MEKFARTQGIDPWIPIPPLDQKIEVQAPKLIEVTPTIAELFLENQAPNRHIKPAHLTVIMEKLKNGEWKCNGHTIKFNEWGQMIDGQHRSKAVLLTGISIMTWAIKGILDEDGDTLDGGKSRGCSDYLQQRGEKNTLAFAASLRQLCQLKHEIKSLTHPGNPSIVEQLAFYEEHPDIQESVYFVHSLPNMFFYKSVAATCHFLFSQEDRFVADKFFTDLTSGTHLAFDSPLLAFRGLVVKQQMKKQRNVVPQMYIVALLIKTWNAYIEKKAVKRISYAHGREKFPVVGTPTMKSLNPWGE